MRASEIAVPWPSLAESVRQNPGMNIPTLPMAVEDGAGLTTYVAGNAALAEPVTQRALETHFIDISPASRALLLSQAGPHSGRVFTVLPTSDDITIASHSSGFCCFVGCVLPWRSAPAHAAAAEASTLLGDHRAACATSGVLPTRALSLEHALARFCREAGARVARNVRVADMNSDVLLSDARKIEVGCNGLPLWHGALLAVDATLVSPLTHDGSPQPAVDAQPGVSLARAAQRKRQRTYPELLGQRRRED
ncbi:hypothetical protein AK812_SmicGene47533 [Symbiodinium microadriaticum]|uniref:Uncharacterized protein n=1 Tax=Symbiodinium microadriaticum TaxID=2951 RepID=A0A1Q9BRH6_SYMMI|nr:hypothetical protein AK812_SmicGene47533 [Symbiodinium microadriaticum]